jgi:hypothetical protein
MDAKSDEIRLTSAGLSDPAYVCLITATEATKAPSAFDKWGTAVSQLSTPTRSCELSRPQGIIRPNSFELIGLIVIVANTIGESPSTSFHGDLSARRSA